MPYNYSIEVCRYHETPTTSQEKKERQHIERYVKWRKRIYVKQLGEDQKKYYSDHPNKEDKKDSTVFFIFKLKNTETNEDIIFGGRRIVFANYAHLEKLPFENKHEVKPESASFVEKFAHLVNGQSLADRKKIDLRDIIPAVQYEDIKCAEIGGFFINPKMRKVLTEDEQNRFLKEIYQKSLDWCAAHGVNIALVEAGTNNLNHQKQWLEELKQPDKDQEQAGQAQEQVDGEQKSASSEPRYDFIILGDKTYNLFTNPFPKGKESRMLLVNLDNKFKFFGAQSILRFRQNRAHCARLDPER